MMMRLTRYLFYVCGALPVLATAPASAQMVGENMQLSFGSLVVPSSGAMVQIEPTGAVSIGENWMIPATGDSPGEYNITGSAGTVDIFVDSIGTCNMGVQLSNFGATWRGTTYADISTTAITAAPFDGDDNLRLGARITYAGTTPLTPCGANFNLNITYY